jgi:hypothetical protein
MKYQIVLEFKLLALEREFEKLKRRWKNEQH